MDFLGITYPEIEITMYRSIRVHSDSDNITLANDSMRRGSDKGSLTSDNSGSILGKYIFSLIALYSYSIQLFLSTADSVQSHDIRGARWGS